MQTLHKDKKPFVIASVINRVMPSSGKPGDKAIIEQDGTLTGWIGGGCTRGIVMKEALEAIASGKPRIVSILPDGPSQTKLGVKEYTMTCHSGGAVEIYIEPIMPRPHILILGKSHVAMALSRIAKAMDYEVSVVARETDQVAFPGVDEIKEKDADFALVQPNSYIVVCTQGDRDEEALEYALKSKVEYVAFIASRKKANAIFHNLRKMGLSFDDLKRIKTPAGMDINAKLPEEVAISILAEIITNLRSEPAENSGESASGAAAQMSSNANIFINPVCGVPVEKATAKHVIEYESQQYYFCCDGCKVSFEKEPAKYALATS